MAVAVAIDSVIPLLLHDRGTFGGLLVVRAITMVTAVSKLLNKVDNYFLSCKFGSLLYI